MIYDGNNSSNFLGNNNVHDKYVNDKMSLPTTSITAVTTTTTTTE